MLKSPEAFRTISEVAETLDVPPHVLRFWETRFAQVKPVKRGGGRRYYRPEDVRLLRGIRGLLYDDGMTIKGVQKILRERGVRHVIGLGTVDPAGDAAGGRAEPAAELRESQVEEFETETTDRAAPDAGPPDSAPPDSAPPGSTRADAGRSDTGPSDAAPAGASERPVPQADLFAARVERPASDAGLADAPRPAGDKAPLRDLIGRLEALRAVMAGDRRA
jgi:DNA-binding transcriptional MerR regulator